MREIVTKIREMSEGIAEANGAFLVDATLRGNPQSQVLEVYVDTDAGITAEGCAAISRDLSTRLDRENLILGRYSLVVSSPGVDRPLKLRRQYHKNLGRSLRVRYRSQEGMKTIVGRLKHVSESGLTLEEKTSREDIDLPFESIEESRIELEWGRTPK